MEIGVGITTRNRPEVLECALNHFEHFSRAGLRVSVVDDTDPEEEGTRERNSRVAGKFGIVTDYVANETRKGIARSKNRSLYPIQNCDYIFLFDDDAFPKRHGWENCFVDRCERYRIEHMMSLVPYGEIQIKRTIEELNVFNNCSGVCLFFTRNAIERIGGYDPRFRVYGMEHGQISQRAYRAGLTGPFGPYISPVDSSSFIYSFDYELYYVREGKVTQPPLGAFPRGLFRSSIHGETVSKYIEENMPYFNNPPTGRVGIEW